jgi:hypothetical protein
VPLA